MPVRGAVGQYHVRAELLEALAAVRAGAVRIDQAADADEVARLELGDRATDLGDPADDLVARHAGVDRGHHVVPLVTSVVQVGMADAAEEDLDLHILLGGYATRDRGAGKRGSLPAGGVCLRRIAGMLLVMICGPRRLLLELLHGSSIGSVEQGFGTQT